MKRFFSADYHFDHYNIIKFENRPFKSVHEMNREIIRKHNERVKEHDKFHFIGDFSFSKDPYKFLKQMNGKFRFVEGNHDRNNKLKVRTSETILRLSGIKVQLVHDPKYAKIEYPLILCGHVHCVTEDTEILTNNGWKNINTISYKDKAISLDKKDKNLYENKILSIPKQYISDNIISYQGSSNFNVTKNHDMFVSFSNSNNFKTKKIKELFRNKNTNYKAFCSGHINHPDCPFTDNEIRLLCWICADGTIEYRNKKPSIRFKLSKKRKIKKLIKLLKDLNIKYSINKCKKENKQRLIPYRINLLKRYPSWLLNIFQEKKQLPNFIKKFSKRQIDILLETYKITDGHKSKHNNTIQLSTSKKEEADLLQEVCVLNGHSCQMYKRNFKNKNDNYVLNIIKNKTTKIINTSKLKSKFYKGRIWCLETEKGTIITRNNGKIIITGNSKWTFRELRYCGKKSLMINVGVDNWNFYPIEWNELFKYYQQWKSNPEKFQLN